MYTIYDPTGVQVISNLESLKNIYNCDSYKKIPLKKEEGIIVTPEIGVIVIFINDDKIIFPYEKN